jgi:anti-anti-sigma factor
VTEIADLTIERIDGVPVARISGEIDTSNARALGDSIAGSIGNDAPGVVVDLTDTSYLDSAGVNLLFDLARRLKRRHQELRVVRPTASFVEEVLEVVSINDAAPTNETVGNAIAALRDPTDADG